MTHHSAHLSTICSSYCHLTVQTVNDLPLSVAGHGTLCSDSFYVPDVSLVPDVTMQLMSAGWIIGHDCHVILDPDFCYIQDRRTVIWLVLAPQRCASKHLWELDWLRLPSIAPTSLVSPAVVASFTSSFSH
jgi:hypothetical protein